MELRPRPPFVSNRQQTSVDRPVWTSCANRVFVFLPVPNQWMAFRGLLHNHQQDHFPTLSYRKRPQNSAGTSAADTCSNELFNDS